MIPPRTFTTFGIAAVSVTALGSAALSETGSVSGPEGIWLVQSDATTEGNAVALEMLKELFMQLKRDGVDYPDGQYMTMDQVNRLDALFDQQEGDVEARDQAKLILGV